MKEPRESVAWMSRTRFLVAGAVTSGALMAALGGAPAAGASWIPVSGVGVGSDEAEHQEATRGVVPAVSAATAYAASGKSAQTEALTDAASAKAKVLRRYAEVVAQYDRAFEDLYALDGGAPTRTTATEKLWSLDASVKSVRAELTAADAALLQAQQQYDSVTTAQERAAEKAAADKAAADKAKADEAAAKRANELAAKKAEVDAADAAAARAVMNRRALGGRIHDVEAELSALWRSGVDPQSKAYRLKKEEERQLNEDLLSHDRVSTPIFDAQSRAHREYDAAVATNQATKDGDAPTDPHTPRSNSIDAPNESTHDSDQQGVTNVPPASPVNSAEAQASNEVGEES